MQWWQAELHKMWNSDVLSLDATRAAATALDQVEKLRELVHRLGAAAVLVSDGIEDEGGQCVLYSTNHAEVLREAKAAYDAYRLETGDMGAEDALSATSE